ncbi:hypothetical protein H0O00_01030 [Candidatus Micrarchaeota archaeon]|nr:hypothetical protein [Candidatus Micrarchaeota archaeon]
MARSPIMAVIMGIIPLVNLYLIYKWFDEFKAATKATYNPIIQLILCFIPLVNIYIVWKFMGDVEGAAKKKGAAGYPMGATIYLLICIFFCWLFGLPILYMYYKTQEMLNTL